MTEKESLNKRKMMDIMTGNFLFHLHSGPFDSVLWLNEGEGVTNEPHDDDDDDNEEVSRLLIESSCGSRMRSG